MEFNTSKKKTSEVAVCLSSGDEEMEAPFKSKRVVEVGSLSAGKKAFYAPDSYQRPANSQLANRFKKSNDEIHVSWTEDFSVEHDRSTGAVFELFKDDNNEFFREETKKEREDSEEENQKELDRLSRVFGLDSSITLIPGEKLTDSNESEHATELISPSVNFEDDLEDQLSLRIPNSKSVSFLPLAHAKLMASSALSTADSRYVGNSNFDMSCSQNLDEVKEPLPYFFQNLSLGLKSTLQKPIIWKHKDGERKVTDLPPHSKAASKTKSQRKTCKVPNEDYRVDLNRIYEAGKTALNIKNIPNKYTKSMLMELFDKEFAGAYNFFYLPIDYNQKCNMGFAFIVFEDLKYIKPFCQRFDNKKWPKFNSEKICEIKYARLQGAADLLNHFKNSSIMRQNDPQYKPYIKQPQNPSEKIKATS